MRAVVAAIGSLTQATTSPSWTGICILAGPHRVPNHPAPNHTALICHNTAAVTVVKISSPLATTRVSSMSAGQSAQS